MIGYVTIGAKDLESSRRFYDAILMPLGGRTIVAAPEMIIYALEGGSTMLAICYPYDKDEASSGNGAMFGIPAPTNALVEEVYRIAIEQGAVDEGGPGYRTPEMYAAYFRDPVGNKLAVYNMPSVAEFAEGAAIFVQKMIAAAQAREA